MTFIKLDGRTINLDQVVWNTKRRNMSGYELMLTSGPLIYSDDGQAKVIDALIARQGKVYDVAAMAADVKAGKKLEEFAK